MAGTISGRSAYNANANERDGTGGLLGGGQLNDYRTQGSVNVVISSVVLQNISWLLRKHTPRWWQALSR
jgi:hypothetical protein